MLNVPTFTAWGLVAVALCCCTPSAAVDTSAQRACPMPDEGARRRVLRLLTRESLAPFRTKYGIADVSASDLRVLSDSSDASTCDKLNEIGLLENYGVEVYFASGNFFFVTAVFNARPGRIPLVQIPVVVIDSAFVPRGGIGM